jgi:agmatinase
MSFDPNSISLADSGLFGLPYKPQESDLLIIPVPWDVTTSNGSGSAKSPDAFIKASKQIDLYHPDLPEFWKVKTALDTVHMEWNDLNKFYRKKALEAIEMQEAGITAGQSRKLTSLLKEVNDQCKDLNNWVYETAKQHLDKGGIVGVLGGDHSCPLGLMKALVEKHGQIGILQIDAHADLREAYEGFEYSHASIFHNALKMKGVMNLLQVGVRDYCKEETEVRNSESRIKCYDDRDLKRFLFGGNTWDNLCAEMIAGLPEKVYISFDIDGLEPSLCPSTGTPVSGGLTFSESTYLIKKIADSGRTIIGFDLCEVVGKKGTIDANIGARILFELCVQTSKSNKLNINS